MSTESNERPITIRLDPLDKVVHVRAGAPLQDALFALGVEFPCGGRGTCKGCRIKVLKGDLPPTDHDVQKFTEADIAAGWRLACQAHVKEDLVLHVSQWDSPILSDNTAFAFDPQDGLGVAVDLGTTTLVAQLLDLTTGQVLAVRTALNPQARHGGDIMSRVEFGVSAEGQAKLKDLIRREIGRMIRELVTASHVAPAALHRCVIVGNTVMHHLFCGHSVEPLSHYPFETNHLGLQVLTAKDVGWDEFTLRIEFLPCFGGFVGSDIVAGVLATRIHESEQIEVLVDLGTNGEMIMGNRHGLFCAATAAGPAFEGARIYMGMRAATGAISRVHVRDGRLVCDVIGEGTPRGICGSGLVDAVAGALDLGLVLPNGRLLDGAKKMHLLDPVVLSQTDIRQLQLAKGAISAGVQLLAQRCGTTTDGVARLHLAGAFGNYINVSSARRIGLLPMAEEKIVASGNAALHGAKLALFSRDTERLCAPILKLTEHMTLSSDPKFQDVYVDEMSFPASGV
ncbi:MAG: ASKHA domain-containing protein [Lentisphaerae bacterium]|nr:ASKHA domain-containing protein [Lentisphaerota bacterium]